MFVVSEEEAAAIRTAFEQHGEFAAAVAVRRMFPGITDSNQVRDCVRIIAGWRALSARKGAVRKQAATKAESVG
jgi:hypothetical protein